MHLHLHDTRRQAGSSQKEEARAEEGPGQLSVTGSLLGVRETGQEGNGDANCIGQVGQVKMRIYSQ